MFSYSAVIRTFNSFPIVEDVIGRLRGQTCPPEKIIVVDSGSESTQICALKSLSDQFVDLSDSEFNYSRSLNAGICEVDSEFVLIVSSHLIVDEPGIIERVLRYFSMDDLGAVSLIEKSGEVWSERWVDRSSFTGVNGLTNSCSIVRTSLVKSLRFREEVFASEDQEWTKRYLERGHGRLLVVSTSAVKYKNPRVNLVKKYNEEISLAIFVDQKRRSVPTIMRWVLRGFWAFLKGNLDVCSHRFRVARGLWRCRSSPLKLSSKYF